MAHDVAVAQLTTAGQLVGKAEDQAAALAKVAAADKQIVTQIDGEFRRAFVGLFDSTTKGWDAMLQSMKTSFMRILAEQLYTFFMKPFVLNIIASVAMGVGATGVAAQATTQLEVANAATNGASGLS